MRPACYDTENGEVYCDQCALDIEPEGIAQECDSPQHCGGCGAPVEYSLTGEGVAYVMEAIRDNLRNGLDSSITPADRHHMRYYAGMPHCSIVGDWARDIRYYGGLSEDDKTDISNYIDLCEAVERRTLDGAP
jgi:hypothetical protein